MSSLSRQLSRLRVPQTSVQKERKGIVSFLYDFLESKSIDNDMHYAIAVSGLQALMQLDPTIGRFGETLLNESSKSLDRALQSTEANQDLDTEIEAFLFTVVSNYFLLNATHKTIEWLIYRYGVNQYNADALIASVLPYHETRLFARLLQTCADPKVETSKWFWLKPIQTSGSPLPKTTLITHCISETSFLRFICDNFIKCIKIDSKNSSFLTFFVSTAINVIERNTNESIVSIIIGYVIEGLKSRNPSLIKACLCITAHICTRIQLQNNIKNKILKAMAKRCKSSLSDELLITLSVMDRFQGLDDLPQKLINCLKYKSLIECHERHWIENLIGLVLKCLLNNCNELNATDELMSLLNQLTLSSQSIDVCIQTISKYLESKRTPIPVNTFSKVLALIELRYPLLLDESLSKLESLSSVAPLLGAFRYSFLKSSKVPLIYGLTHVNESVQKEAIDHLIKNFDELVEQKDELTISTLKNLLSNALSVKTPQILISIFGLKEKMFEIFTEEEMTEFCQNLLNFCHIKDENSEEDKRMVWHQLKNSIVATYCSIDCNSCQSFGSFIFPYLLPLNKLDFITLSIILNSKSAKNIELYNILANNCKSIIKTDITENNIDSIVSLICTQFANYYIKNPDLICDNIFIHNNQSLDYLKSCSLSVLILERIHVLSSDADIKEKSANILLTLFETMIKSMKFSKPKHSFETFESFLSNYLKNLRKNRINLSNILFVINSLIDSIDSSVVPKSQSSVWFWFKQLKSNNYFYKLFLLLFNNCYDNNKSKSIAFRKTFIRFIHKMFEVIGFDYFSPLWTNTEIVLLQSRSVAVSSHLFKTNVSFSEITILSALIAMHSPLSNCRESALIVAKHLSHHSDNYLLNHCLENSESIKNDENTVSRVIADWFSSNPKSKVEKKKMESIRKDWINVIDEDKTPEHIKWGVVLLFNKCDNNILNEIIIKMRSYLKILYPINCQMKTIKSLLSIYSEPNIFKSTDSQSDILFNFFIESIQTKYSQEIALNMINKKLFESLSTEDSKICLLNELLEIIVQKSDRIANKKLKKLIKRGDLISSLLQSLVRIDDSVDYSEPKAKRMLINDSQFSLESSHWKKFIILLEIINSKSNLTDVSILVKNLFDYLKMTFIIDSKSSLEYLRQLLLSSIINCMKQNAEELPSVQIESVIECLRESQQKETQKIALILISSVANQFKEEILDYVITIFTFIGTNLLHCDDQYSIQIVSDTMEAIIPILLNDVNDTKDVVINVFIDSLPDIPSHRRLHLFRSLLNILGEKEHLALIFMKVVERIFNKSKLEKEPFLSLIVALSRHCDINVQIESLNKIMDVFNDEFTDGTRVLSITDQNFSDIDRRLIAQSLAQIILRIVSSQEFIQTTISSEWTQISDQLLAFLHRLIVLIAKYNVSESENFVKDSNTHRKRIRSLLYQILLQFNSILPNQQLIELVLELLKKDSHLIQRKALELLNEKIVQIPDQTLNRQQLKHLLQSITSMVPTGDSVNQMDEQLIYNTQLSMITLKLLSKHIGDNDKLQQLVYHLIEQIILLISKMKDQISVNFKASCILCLTQLMICLGNKAIPLIPSVFPLLLNNFNFSDEVIIVSNMTSILKITQKFPQFLSPYLDQIIIKLLNVCYNSSQIKTKLKSIWSCFAKLIPKRVLFTSLDLCYDVVSNISLDSLCEFMSLLKMTFENISNKSEVNIIQKFVKNLLVKALDFRNLNQNNRDLNEINKFENSCNDAFSVFIPKMTEITFRPLFYKLYDWALREKGGTLYYRMISFYKLLELLADRLKSLFCIFIGPSIVNNCSQMLSLFHSDNHSDLTLDSKTSHLLIVSILATLSKCFMHDINGAFLNRDRMQALAKPIINQLSNTLGTDEDYNQRVDALCLCTQYLIESNKDETVIKDFNYQILLKTRETSTEVRFGALRVLHRLILVSGEDYLPIIPETIPFISELSEDDSIDIEELVKTVVTDLEQILGEPINKYL